MQIIIDYSCNERGAEQRATCTIDVENGSASVSWEFDPPISDDTRDPAGLITALINTVLDTLTGKPTDQPAEGA